MSRAHHIKMTGWLTVIIALGGAVSMGLPVRSPGQVHGPKPRPAPQPRPKQAPPPPKPIMTVSQPVIFTDEEVTLSWTTANATSTYVTMIGEVFQHGRLLPGVIDHDPAFRYSGTAYPHRSQIPDHTPYPKPPTIPGVPSRRDLQHSPKKSNWERSGQKTLRPGPDGTGTWSFTLSLSRTDTPHPSASSTHASLNVLGAPKFTGTAATPEHVNQIRSYLKEIDQKLRIRGGGPAIPAPDSGCIEQNNALDTEVAAFRDHKLRRSAVSQRLIAEIQNGQNLTFQCEETKGPKGAVAEWQGKNNPNTIILYGQVWQGGPNVSYSKAVLHELLHKCGFNEYLLQWYSRNDPKDPDNIESQTDRVARSCYPK